MTSTNANMMRNRFKMDLANEGYELRKLLSQNDVKNRAVLQNCLNTFNDHLKVVASRYALELGQCNSKTSFTAMKAPVAWGGVAGKVGGGIGGWMAGGTLATVTVATKTTGWWIFKKTVAVSLADSIAAAIGISTGAATFGLSVILAGAGAYAVTKMVNGFERESIISRVMDQYEHDTVPKLLDWFDRQLALPESSNYTQIGY